MASTSARRRGEPAPTEEVLAVPGSRQLEQQQAETSSEEVLAVPGNRQLEQQQAETSSVHSELRRVRRQAITLGVMTAVSTFVTIVLYRLVEREIFYNPKARSSADVHPYAESCLRVQHGVQNDDQSLQTSVASLLKSTQCLRPAEKNHLLLQKAPTQCDQHNKQGGAGGQDYTCARDKPGTEDSSSWMGVLPYLRETLCLDADCSGRTDIEAEVALLVDGRFVLFYDTRLRLMESFLGTLLRGFHVCPGSVWLHLVLFSPDLWTWERLRSFPGLRPLMDPLSPWTGHLLPNITTLGGALTFIRRGVLTEGGGARPLVPRVLLLLTSVWWIDYDAPGAALELRGAGVEVFVVDVLWDGVSRMDELEVLASPPAAAHLFKGEHYGDLQRLLPELTESICLRVQHKMKSIKHSLVVPKEEEAEAGAKEEEAEAGAKGEEEAEAGEP
ncbi:uncharacterized protein LOC144806278 isoform X2 [Lissotriton helveticus]